jgi:copper chaperone NosL
MMRAARAAVSVGLAAAALACTPADGPQPIAWDREPCAHCRMLIGDPAFAAQLQTDEGVVASFDDPGCLLSAEASYPGARALWFHHLREDRWIAGDRVAFVRVPRTPMGFGLGAVEAGAPDSVSLAEARAAVAAARPHRSAP